MMMIRPRFVAKALANLGGYFWMPCPICLEPYAGFEVGPEALWDTIDRGTCVCPKPACQATARHLNEQAAAKRGFRIIVSL